MTLRVAQFFLKIAHLSFSMGPRGPRAYGLRPRLWLLITVWLSWLSQFSISLETPLTAALTPAHTRGHVAGTAAGRCCSDSFPRVTSPFLRKRTHARRQGLMPDFVISVVPVRQIVVKLNMRKFLRLKSQKFNWDISGMCLVWRGNNYRPTKRLFRFVKETIRWQRAESLFLNSYPKKLHIYSVFWARNAFARFEKVRRIFAACGGQATPPLHWFTKRDTCGMWLKRHKSRTCVLWLSVAISAVGKMKG